MRQKTRLRKKLIATVVLVMLAIPALSFLWQKGQDLEGINGTKSPNAQQSPAGFDKSAYAIDQPGSLWWIVNKSRALPTDYVPSDLVVPNVPLRLNESAEQMQLRKQPATALENLFAGAKQAGYTLYLASGYRSAAYQKVLYDGYVAKDGQAATDKYSARPGTSEHQTGMAADVGRPDKNCELEICFGDTLEGKWVKAHAHEYGFVVRYEQGKESVTTYQYEPWHLRYVGKELASELTRTGQSMEEFFGL